MAKGRFPLFGSVQRGGDGATGKQCNEEGNGGKGGKLRLSRTALFKKKPYDRPLPSGTLDRPSSSGSHGVIPSLPSRLVDSASNLLTSSASYLFESFFKRRQTLWISQGIQPAVGRGSTDAQHSEGLKPLTCKFEKHALAPLEGSLKEGSNERAGQEDMGLVEVEEFLKRQLLSREEVKRLTEVLQTQTYGGSVVGKAHTRQEIVKQIGEDSNPVQLAKAYMGRRTTLQWQSTPPRCNEVAGPSSGSSLQEGIYKRASEEASRARLAPGASARMLKRRLIAEDEDDGIVTVPTRRVRQKMAVLTNTSPYIRQVTTATGRLRTPSVPVLLPNETTDKNPEPSEEPAVPSKGKSVEEPLIVSGPSYIEDLPESSKARDGDLLANRGSSLLPTSSDPVEPSCMSPEAVVTMAPTSLERSVSGSSAPSTSELPVVLPQKTRGFRISAFFEDSSSDEEADLPVRSSTSSEAQLSRPLIVKEAQEVTMLKQPLAVISDDLLCASATDYVKKDVLTLSQLSGATGPSNTKSDRLHAVSSAEYPSESPFTVSATDKSAVSFPSLKPFATVSCMPAMIKEGGESTVVPESTRTLPVVSSVSLFSSPLTVPLPLPSMSAAEASVPVSDAEAATAGLISLPSQIATKQKVEAVENGAQDASGFFSASAPQPAAVSAENVTPFIAAPAAAPKLSAAGEASSAGEASPAPVTQIGIGPSFAGTPAAMPVVNQVGMSGTLPITLTAADSSLAAGGNRRSSTPESPNADNKHSDLDTMATDPMTEEPDSSIVSASAPAFLFGSTSTPVSTLMGKGAAFVSHSASSPFSFPTQSTTPSEVPLSIQSPFNSQSSTTGQLFTFGNSANPFTANSQSTFSFGSSAAASMPSTFTTTSSAPLTFPATSPAPSAFLFGAQASSSSLTKSTSGFGGQVTPSAGAFNSAGVQKTSPAFPFQASSTPTPLSFQFGGASAGTSSMSTSPSFGGQTYTFGGQPTNVAADPFAQSGGSNASPFQFGGVAAASSQPVISSGPTSASSFQFGAQPAASPFPFAFGGQRATASPGQPYAFGGQPSAPAQSPFTLPGSTGPAPAGASGMDFAGGFSLGAAGGEKTGRKFIKAKRIGGSKRGK